MNARVITSETVAKLKRLNARINDLETIPYGLSSDQQIELIESKEKLNELIQKL